jgi:hypothetical protein
LDNPLNVVKCSSPETFFYFCHASVTFASARYRTRKNFLTHRDSSMQLGYHDKSSKSSPRLTLYHTSAVMYVIMRFK